MDPRAKSRCDLYIKCDFYKTIKYNNDNTNIRIHP